MTANPDTMLHLLVIDDDTRIRELLVSYLSDNGYRVSAARDASEARARMTALAFDLIILDIMMPGEDGLSLSRSLREAKDNVPILFLSALADPNDRIEGLMAGGDDYLGKPFEPKELLLRIQSILRRGPNEDTAPTQVLFGDFVFNLERGELHKGDEPVRLTTREKDMLRTLASANGEVVPRTALSQSGEATGSRGVDVQINRLRAKIEATPAEPRFLQTVRGRGYVLLVD